jgi:hypothetical protein
MVSRKMLLANLAAALATFLAPSIACAGEAAPTLVPMSAWQGDAEIAATDISAARRRHHAYRGSAAARSAFGSIADGPVYEAPVDTLPSYGGGYAGFGYGVGDNSRNQSW